MACKGGGAAVVGSWDWKQLGDDRAGCSGAGRAGRCSSWAATPRGAGPCLSLGAASEGQHREGSSHVRAAHAHRFNGIFLFFFFPPVTEKEAPLPLPKAGVNVCRRRDTCSARTSREPGCSQGGSGPAGTARTEQQLIAAGRRRTEAAGRNREG